MFFKVFFYSSAFTVLCISSFYHQNFYGMIQPLHIQNFACYLLNANCHFLPMDQLFVTYILLQQSVRRCQFVFLSVLNFWLHAILFLFLSRSLFLLISRYSRSCWVARASFVIINAAFTLSMSFLLIRTKFYLQLPHF